MRHPLRDALLFGAVARCGIEDEGAIAAFGLCRLDLADHLVEHLLGAGDLLADLDAADAERGVERMIADFKNGVFE